MPLRRSKRNKNKKPTTFFKRTQEEVKLKLSCAEAVKFREEKKQREKIQSLL